MSPLLPPASHTTRAARACTVHLLPDLRVIPTFLAVPQGPALDVPVRDLLGTHVHISGMAGSRGRWVRSILRNCQTVSQSGRSISQPACSVRAVRAPRVPHVPARTRSGRPFSFPPLGGWTPRGTNSKHAKLKVHERGKGGGGQDHFVVCEGV